eukprot:scaffold223500_cov31-Tisochrysis_lutea.AAC.1
MALHSHNVNISEGLNAMRNLHSRHLTATKVPRQSASHKSALRPRQRHTNRLSRRKPQASLLDDYVQSVTNTIRHRC